MTSIYEEVRIALYGIWHRRWPALGVAWLVCLAGWLVVATVPNTYESKARIFVQIDDVPPVAVNEVGNLGHDARLIRAGKEQDGVGAHGETGRKPMSRDATRKIRGHPGE